MAKFKCIQSGNVIEFVHQYDIDSMKGHPDYIRLDDSGNEIKEEEVQDYRIPLKPPIPTVPPAVKRGRPSKKA